MKERILAVERRRVGIDSVPSTAPSSRSLRTAPDTAPKGPAIARSGGDPLAEKRRSLGGTEVPYQPGLG